MDTLLKTLDSTVCGAYQIDPLTFPPNDYDAMEEVFQAYSDKGSIPQLLLSFAVGVYSGDGIFDSQLVLGDQSTLRYLTHSQMRLPHRFKS